MNSNNPNDLAIVALCTNLGDPNSTFNPLTNLQYNHLATKLYNSSIQSPSNLLEKINELDSYWEELNLSFEMKDRIEYLLSPERVIKVHMGVQDLLRRNIQIITRASKNYPNKLKSKLLEKRPAVLFYTGNLDLVNEDIVGIVGSRNIGREEEDYINIIVKELVSKSKTIISGGANGSDKTAEDVVIENEGNLILFLSFGMNKKITDSKVIKHLINDKMLILSESVPSSNFQVFSAMNRNKYIYALSDYVVVAKTDYKKGGTWSGATEALKNNYCDVFLKSDNSIGFRELIKLGAKVYKDNNYDAFKKNEKME